MTEKNDGKMTCDDCQYLGKEFVYLRDYKGIKNWMDCIYPLPYYVTPVAIPKDAEHNCKVKKLR